MLAGCWMDLVVDEIGKRGFLADGGEMGALMRGFDWIGTALGGPEDWPQSLKAVVRVLLTTKHPMFIWWGPDLIQFYNDAYRETMGPERHPTALGQPGRLCWDEIWPIIGPQIEFVMQGKGATWHENQLVPVTRNGSREQVWWTYSYSPINDDEDRVGGVLVVCKDVTEQHLLIEAVRRVNEHLATESERLHQLFSQAPGFMCVLSGPLHHFELTNAAYLQLVGYRTDLIGKSVRDAIPEAQGQGFLALLDQVYATGQAFVGHQLPLTLQNTRGRPAETRYIDFVYQPIIGPDKSVSGIFVQGSDVTDRVQAQERQSLLIRELHHRVRNTLATVQAIMGSTARASESIAEFQQAFAGRISSLAKTHSLLTEDEWQTVPLLDLFSVELDPYDDGTGKRIILDGPRVELPSLMAVPIGMAVHELTTNSAKYGSLSEIGGSVQINWEIRSEGSTREILWTWTEQGGPVVNAPKRQGFGSVLLQRVLKIQIGAKVVVNYAADGLQVTVKVPWPEAQSFSES